MKRGSVLQCSFFIERQTRGISPIHGLHQPFEMAIIVNVNLESLNLYVSLPQKRVIQIELEKGLRPIKRKKKMPFSYLFSLWSRVLFAVVPTQLQCMTG